MLLHGALLVVQQDFFSLTIRIWVCTLVKTLTKTESHSGLLARTNLSIKLCLHKDSIGPPNVGYLMSFFVFLQQEKKIKSCFFFSHPHMVLGICSKFTWSKKKKHPLQLTWRFLVIRRKPEFSTVGIIFILLISIPLKYAAAAADIDECAEVHSCDGICLNVIGSYMCTPCPHKTVYDTRERRCTPINKSNNFLIGRSSHLLPELFARSSPRPHVPIPI